MADAFDPRPLRIGAVVAIACIALPGSLTGAALLWNLGGGALALPLPSPSTHALLQLAGGFMSLIWVFLAIGVPHLLGLDAARARRVLWPLGVVVLALAGVFVGDVVGNREVGVGARFVGAAGAALGLVVFVHARAPHARPLTSMPLPFLALALCLYPFAWLSFALEALGHVPLGVGADAMLFVVVMPVVLSMGFQMFSAMLQIDAGHRPLFAAAVCVWIAGGALLITARVQPLPLPLFAPFLGVGAALWMASLHGLRRRRRGLVLEATAGPELRAHVLAAAGFLLTSPLVWLASAWKPVLADVARHMVAVGFVLCITMGVTLRALPRFCRGRPSSPRLALWTLGALVLGVLLRGARAFDGLEVLVRVSSASTSLAVLVWAAHLARGLPERRG